MILKNISNFKIFIPLCIFFTSSSSKTLSQTPLSLSIKGPTTAPIYVVDGKFKIKMMLVWPELIDYADSTERLYLDCELNTKSDAATGTTQVSGKLWANGYFDKGSRQSFISWWPGPNGLDPKFNVVTNTVSGKLKIGQKGNSLVANGVLRANAWYKEANSFGSFRFGASPEFNFKNLTIDPRFWIVNIANVKLGGWIYNGIEDMRVANRNLEQVPRYQYPDRDWQWLIISYPDQDRDGLWDCEGSWQIQLNTSIDNKNKITGTANFHCMDKFEAPYENIELYVSGKLQKGIITLLAFGKTKSTKNISVSLSFRQSNLEIISKKNFVSAYGQTRRF